MVDEYAFALANIAVFGDLIILHQPYLSEFISEIADTESLPPGGRGTACGGRSLRKFPYLDCKEA